MKLKDKLKPEYLKILNQDTNHPHLCDEITTALEEYEYLINLPYGVILSMELLLGNVSSPYNYFNIEV